MNETKHRIKINDMMVLEIKMPEEMTITDFRAITQIASAVFKFSGIEEMMPVVQKVESKTEEKKIQWTEDKKAFIFEKKTEGILNYKKIAEAFNEKFNEKVTDGAVYMQLKKMNKTGGSVILRRSFTPEMKNKIIELKQAGGKTAKEIMKELKKSFGVSISKASFYNHVGRIKAEGLLK